ncbi:MAG: hypothetical protein JWR48_5659 [Mycobacterium sp.]|nr:hypothetical protein [Mycobacterium sp.]
MPLHVGIENRVQLRFRHLRQGNVPDDPGIVHQDVKITKGLDGCPYQTFAGSPICHIGEVWDRNPTLGAYFSNHTFSSALIPTGAFYIASNVVHDQLCPSTGEEEGMVATESPPTTRDDGHSAL